MICAILSLVAFFALPVLQFSVLKASKLDAVKAARIYLADAVDLLKRLKDEVKWSRVGTDKIILAGRVFLCFPCGLPRQPLCSDFLESR